MTTPPRPPERDPSAREREQLATFLAVLLTVLFGGGFVVFLVIITLNVFLGVIAVAAGMSAFVALHYVLWGRPRRGEDRDDRSRR